jgi:hypothetical protein
MTLHELPAAFEMTTQQPARYSVGVSVLVVAILSIAGWAAVIAAAYLIF